MNYFERLVLRALRQPAGEHSVAVSDPFENIDEWPLEAIASVPAHQQLSRSIEVLRTEVPAPREDTPLAPPTSPVTLAPLETALSAPAITPAMDLSPPLRAMPAPPPHGQPAAEPMTAPELHEPQSALAAADRFMQAIGVRVPGIAPPDADETSSPAHTRTAAAPAVAAAALAPPVVQRIAPPAPATPDHAVPRSPPPLIDDSALTRESATEPAAIALQSAPKIVETQRVIVVGPGLRDGTPAPATGAGSPFYGLGQL